MPQENSIAVRTFISYSWSSPTHESWVLNLATRLREDGVDAILDKWDLQHGHDAYKFMEQMVTDNSVSKVLMICDRVYAEKADRREGGVGTESQIISPELYGKASQNKFAAAITEVDDAGNAHVPTFYKGRIYFNFSSDEKYEQQYEELLRWILGKPSKIKPELGMVPRYLEIDSYSPATESKFQRTMVALKQSSPNAIGFFKEFSDTLVVDFEKLRISGVNKQEFDNEIIASIENARPYLEQIIDLTISIARYVKDSQALGELISILERLAKFRYAPPAIGPYTDWDFDNYKYLCHEIFLTIFAVLLREGRFDFAKKIVEHAYFIDANSSRGRATQSYDTFRMHLKSLDSRNQRLNLNRISIHADLLEKTYKDRAPNFVDLMQADFVLYLRDAALNVKGNAGRGWHPVTLVFAENRYRPFDVFARSESKSFFEKFAPLLHFSSADQFKAFIGNLQKSNLVPQFDYHCLDVATLSNATNIGVVP